MIFLFSLYVLIGNLDKSHDFCEKLLIWLETQQVVTCKPQNEGSAVNSPDEKSNEDSVVNSPNENEGSNQALVASPLVENEGLEDFNRI